MNTDLTKDLIDFIEKGPTPYQTVFNTGLILENNGFKELNLSQKWEIDRENKYYITNYDSFLIAFTLGTGEIEEEGFKIIAAHTDSPTFRIKPSPEMVESSYLKLNTEVYGGPILNTWFDRPLGIAGRVSLESEDSLNPEFKLVDFKSPVLTIPNLAIHLNKDVNKGIELNKQKDLLPLLSLINDKFEKDNFLIKNIADKLSINPEKILDFDLFLYEYEKGKIIGLNKEFISSSKLDDLAMVHAGLTAITYPELEYEHKGINVLALFNNEEVGSKTEQGADSPLFRDILERIALSLNKDRMDFLQSLNNSFMISADMAHALHPNYPEKNDPTNKPVINKGPVIKINANKNYITDSRSGSIYEMICKNADIPVQKFVNRSDQRGGTTIGPISATQLGINSLDIGNPMLAMHSIRELAGVKDHNYIIKSFNEFYQI